MLNREQKQARLQELKTNLQERRNYLQELNDFEKKHKLVYVPEKGYKIDKSIPEVEQLVEEQPAQEK